MKSWRHNFYRATDWRVTFSVGFLMWSSKHGWQQLSAAGFRSNSRWQHLRWSTCRDEISQSI